MGYGDWSDGAESGPTMCHVPSPTLKGTAARTLACALSAAVLLPPSTALAQESGNGPGPTTLRFSGSITELWTERKIDLELHSSGPDLAELRPLFRAPLPSTPPYELRGRLQREGDQWRFSDATGRIGDSDVAGDLRVDTSVLPPLVELNLHSDGLELSDAVEVARRAFGPDETAAPRERLLPDEPLDLERLRRFDLEFSLRAQQVHHQWVPLESLHAEVQLREGSLRIEPLIMAAAGGSISGWFTFGARERRFSTAFALEGLELGRIVRELEFAEVDPGLFGGTIRLRGSGDSVAGMLAQSDGRIALVMSGATLRAGFAELVGERVADALELSFNERDPAYVRCAVALVEIEGGVMEAESLLVVIDGSTVIGSGRFDLGSEEIDLEFELHPDDPPLLALRPPVRVEGRALSPEISVETARLVSRFGAAAVLGAFLSPVAGILPLIERGFGEEGQCDIVVERARAQAE
jgi:AsmA family protein